MNKAIDFIKSLNYFQSSIEKDTTEEEILWHLTRNIIRKLDFVDCVIYKYNADKEVLVQCAAFGTKNPSKNIIYNQIEIKLGHGIVGYVSRTLIPEVIYDTSKDLRYIVDDEKRLSEICVPIIINNKLYGVIDCEHSDKEFFTQLHLQLLILIASICAQKLKSLKLNTRNPITNDNKYFKLVEDLMRNKKRYKDETLTVERLADELNISSGYLSKIVSNITGKKMADYVNAFRVEEVKENIVSDAFSHYTLLSIGLEAGFNSKASFYRNFKKITGLSPSEFNYQTKHIKAVS